MLKAEERRAYSEDCIRLGREPNISLQRATMLSAMSKNWTGLAGQLDRYEAVVKMQGE
jgi:hypothetical protein